MQSSRGRSGRMIVTADPVFRPPAAHPLPAPERRSPSRPWPAARCTPITASPSISTNRAPWRGRSEVRFNSPQVADPMDVQHDGGRPRNGCCRPTARRSCADSAGTPAPWPGKTIRGSYHALHIEERNMLAFPAGQCHQRVGRNTDRLRLAVDRYRGYELLADGQSLFASA